MGTGQIQGRSDAAGGPDVVTTPGFRETFQVGNGLAENHRRPKAMVETNQREPAEPLFSRVLLWQPACFYQLQQGGKKAMKKIFAGFVLAATSLLAAPAIGVSVGVGIPVGPVGVGVYAGAPAPVVVAPSCPGPGYTWVGGGWYFAGGRRVWRQGYWAPAHVEHFRGYGHFRR
jgi:hypothetical protein